MSLINKIYRKLSETRKKLNSKCRIMHFRIKYPSLKIVGNTFLGKGCDIVCIDGASLTISDCFIASGSFIVAQAGATLKISESSVGKNSVIVAYDYIEIKPHCSIAEMVVIRDQDHGFSGDKLIKDSGYTTGPVVIGENVWIGAKATILKNVTIGKNSVVGAHSLVNSQFPEFSVIAGVPAKIVREL